jgi:FtsZ-binding cell division protein ZapB
MNQRTTGLMVGLVIFVILSVGLLATTIYLQVIVTQKSESESNATKERSSAMERANANEQAFKALAKMVTGDAGMSPSQATVTELEKALVGSGYPHLKAELETLRSKSQQLEQDNDNLKKQTAAGLADANAAREEAKKTMAAAEAARRKVEGDVDGYRASSDKFGSEVKDAVASITKVQFETDQRHREELAQLQGQLTQAAEERTTLSTRVADLQESVDQYRIKPANAASLVDGRIIDVADEDGRVFVSIGSRQRVQPGMVFDVYDSPASIQYNPSTSELIPGKARIQILKVEQDTSTARVIPEETKFGTRAQRPVVKDDVIANAIFSPDHRYKFLVHGMFDVDNDGKATAAETEYVRARIQAWGGDVVEGDKLQGDLDFVVMGVKPMKPLDLSSSADAGQFSAHLEQQRAFESYQVLFQDAQTARIPVLNWNRMQVLTNEGR